MIHRTAVGLAVAGAVALGVPGALSAASATTTIGETTAQTAPRTATAPQTAAAVAVPGRYLNQKLAWELCDDETQTQCALMTVPRDWLNPNVKVDLKIAVSRTEPLVGKGKRFVFGNPGGPGASGLGMAPYLATLPGLKDHVGIGFDPRGTGGSTNLTCDGAPGFTMDARDRSKATLDLVAAAAKMTSTYCATMSRGLMPFVTTEQTVRDMDLLRQLLGAPTIDYVGYSGGTWLGAYYQKYFPKAVGRFVLDSNTDFTREWSVTFEAQPQSFERRFRKDFVPWAAKYDAKLKLGATPAAVLRYYEKLRADLVKRPAVIEIGYNFVFELDANFLDQDIAGGLYSKQAFTYIAADMALLRELWDAKKSGGGAAVQRVFEAAPAAQQARLAKLADERRSGTTSRPVSFDAPTATFLAITCNDTVWPRGQAYLDRLAGRQGPKYPLVGWTLNQQPCSYWNRPSLAMPTPDGAGIGKTVMVQSEHDPATNARLATDAHANYRGSVLITVTDEGDHGIYGGVNPCVDNLVNTWLNTGKAPTRDTTCKGTGLLPPTQEGARAAAPATQLERINLLSDRLAASMR